MGYHVDDVVNIINNAVRNAPPLDEDVIVYRGDKTNYFPREAGKFIKLENFIGIPKGIPQVCM